MNPLTTQSTQEMTDGQSHYYGRNETLDSNGNEIRGRKIDSPHLIVVREMRETDEEDYIPSDELLNQFGTGSEELANLIWSSKDLKFQGAHNTKNELSSKRLRKTLKQSKSQDNKHRNKRSSLGKPKLPHEIPKKNQLEYSRINARGTKSSRDIRTSMGFQELLNQLEKDQSIQQSNVVDFKNRTMHDMLKLDLSGIRKQSSGKGKKTQSKIPPRPHQNEQRIKMRSKSQEKKNYKKEKGSNKEIFQYTYNINQTPERPVNQGPNAASFLNSEHGRCVTSQAINSHNNTNVHPLANNRTKSHSNLGQQSKIFHNPKQVTHPSTTVHHQKDQSSAEKVQVREFKPIGNIDKLIRENLKKQSKKENQEKLNKQKSEENLKKKKEELEQKNNQVRLTNKQKIYKKQIQANTIVLNPDLDQGEMHDIKAKMKKAWHDSAQFRLKLKDKIDQQKQCQTQTMDFEKLKLASRGKNFSFKNSRKSYGLEFIDIKKEIQEELKTIDERIIRQSQGITKKEKSFKNLMNDLRDKDLKIKVNKSSKNEIIEKEATNKNCPINKVIVIKKSKIRKFMKAKKKEIHHQQVQQKQQEMIKLIKQHENLQKLDQFCKKGKIKLKGRPVKSRIAATIQFEEDQINKPKKIVKKLNIRGQSMKDEKFNKKKFAQTIDEEVQDSSSRLSTEFYEEYFRLLNSIRKEEIIEQSQEEDQDSGQKAASAKKRKTNQRSTNDSFNKTGSPVSFNQPNQFQQQQAPSPYKEVKNITKIKQQPRRKGSKKNVTKLEQSKEKTKKVKRQTALGMRQESSDGYVKILKNQEILTKISRAESAPLVKLNVPQNRDSSASEAQQQVEETSQYKNSERLHYFLEKVIKIQRAFRRFLSQNGFYLRYHQFTQEEEGEEFDTVYYAGDTIKRIDNLNEPESLHEDVENEERPSDEIQQEEEEEEYEEFEEINNNLLIVNPNPIDDDKKVVYLSNINSCSLPITPKDLNEHQNQQEGVKKVFEYKIFDSLKKPSQSEEISPKADSRRSKKQELEKLNLEEEEKRERGMSSQRNKNTGFEDDDYMMRIMTGSEKMVREFKQQTPKNQHIVLNLKNSQEQSKKSSIQSSQSSVRNYKPIIVTENVDNSKNYQDLTSQSSQSIFDRNPFQRVVMERLNQIGNNNEFNQLIEMREKAVEYKEQKERKLLKKMHKNNQMSPRTYQNRTQQLEKWVKIEQEEIQKTKKSFQQEWDKTLSMIEETQKNVEQMRLTMKLNIEPSSHYHNHFHSQTSRSSSQTNLLSSQIGERKRSILEEQPPSSTRNLRLAQSQLVQNQEQTSKQEQKDQSLLDFLEEKRKEKAVENSLKSSFNEESKNLKESSGNQGIYIEDQQDDQVQPSSSQISSFGEGERIDFEKIEEEHKAMMAAQQNEEKSLNRSRSEKSLSEIMKKTDKVSVKDMQGDTLNLLSSQKLGSTNRRNDQITIQENLYIDDELENIPSQAQQQEDFYSNESMLNESINNYIQDQQFSLEDFKSLDKKQLLKDQEDMDEGQNQKNNHRSENEAQRQLLFDQVQESVEESQEETLKPYDISSSIEIQGPQNQVQQQNTDALFNQAHLLFQNARPGENIKISDILRKSQNLTSALSNNESFEKSNQSLQQTQVIDEVSVQQQQQEALADQLTEELLQQLLGSSLEVPKRSEPSPPIPQATGQEDNLDIFFVDQSNNEKEQKREMVEVRQRFLLEQDLQKMEIYINEIIQVLLQSELQQFTNDYNFQDIQEFHRIFLDTLTNPIKKNELDILNSLQTSEIGTYQHFETAQDVASFPILPIDLYLEIERQREENQLRQLGSENETLETSVVQESIHIYNKAIFDALNESLMKFRPHGIQGEPMPWSNKIRRLQTRVDPSSVDTETLFQMVKQDVLRWAQNFCGCLPSPVFSFKKNGENEEKFDEELFQETRERRLAALLANEVLETEHQWLNYEFEEAQVKIDLSDMILEHLVEETVELLNQKMNQ